VKRPAFQFYPGDWLHDAHLRLCSLESRGLWIDMLALMHQAAPYGHLVFNGKAATPLTLSRVVGGTPKDVARLVRELEEAGVFSRDTNGIIYSRRMVKDETVRNARAAGGPKGSKHGEKGGLFGSLGGRPKGGEETPLTPGSESPPFRAAVEEEVFKLPAWINPNTWDEYLSMRVKIRKPATERAKMLIVDELDALRKQDDANKILDQSIANSWQGVFPLRAKSGRDGVDAWWVSDEGIQRKGAELGMSPKPGETMASYRDRIKSRLVQVKAA
jgi:hypothetical protein